MGASVRKDCVVGLVYDLRDDRDQLLESRTPNDPFYYVHGHEQVLPAIERAIQGQTSGFRTTLNLSADQAYGPYERALVAEMQRRQFPKGMELREGMKFNTQGPEGKPLTIRIVEMIGERVIVDGNHPLAGLSLTFEILIHSVRAATEEELQSGTPHPADRSHLH